MKATSTSQPVTCVACGAVVEVGVNTRFTSCKHCGAQLHVERSDSNCLTTAMESIRTLTSSIEGRVQTLKSQTRAAELSLELNRLDEEQREATGVSWTQFKIEASAFGIAMAVAFSIEWVAALVILVPAIIYLSIGAIRAASFANRCEQFQIRRATIESQLASLKDSAISEEELASRNQVGEME